MICYVCLTCLLATFPSILDIPAVVHQVHRYLNTFNQYTNNMRLALRCTRLPWTMCVKSWYSAAPGSIPHARRIWTPHAVLDAGISVLDSTRWQTTHATVHRRSGPRLYQQDWLIQGLWWLISSRNLISVGSVSQNFDCCNISCWTGMPGRSRLVSKPRFSSRCALSFCARWEKLSIKWENRCTFDTSLSMFAVAVAFLIHVVFRRA